MMTVLHDEYASSGGSEFVYMKQELLDGFR